MCTNQHGEVLEELSEMNEDREQRDETYGRAVQEQQTPKVEKYLRTHLRVTLLGLLHCQVVLVKKVTRTTALITRLRRVAKVAAERTAGGERQG